MKSKCCHFLCLFIWFLLLCFSYADSGSSEGKIQCIASEREALLQFKQAIKVDYCGLLKSWVGLECCQWYGIRCNNHSSHVIGLVVNGYYDYLNSEFCLGGTLSPSLVELKHLKYLDLSNNNFQYQPIPSFIGSLLNLNYLNLSHNDFVGEIPHQLANLSSLTSLDLSNNNPIFSAKNLRWLSHLTLLTDINLSSVDLSLATDWMQTVNNLPLLKSLHMDECSLSMQMYSPLLEYTNSSTTLHTLSLDRIFERSLMSNLTRFSSSQYTNSSTTLHALSLQDNSFKNTRILEWVSNVTRLSSTFSYLHLSGNGFSGPIPSSVGSIHSLLHLDLSRNRFEGPILETISNFKHLVHLDLSWNSFEGPIPETISNLTNLVHLDLSLNKFQGRKWNPEVLGSLCRLQMLSLARNNITNELSTIIQPLSKCVHRSLVSLNIQYNSLWGSLPNEIDTFSSLRELDLSMNQLNGTISPSLGKLSMLEKLDLSYNQLNGTISPSLGQLSMLETLDLSYNSLKGTLTNHHFSNISRLTYLDLSDNLELVLNISANWVPPFQLDVINLGSCKMGPYFPKWLLTQTNFTSLDISNANISDIIPTFFWDLLTSNLGNLDMSGNMIHGNIPDVPILFHNYPEIDLSSNSFHGGIPSFLINTSALFLNDNCFSNLAPFFCPKTKVLLSTLRLSNNKLSGELPSCWGYFDQLTSLYLDNNNFSGKLPESIGMMAQLEALHLRNNSISGKLPVALQNCTSLVILDLSYNSVTGHIPHWIGHHFAGLVVLNLRNNNLLGGVPLSVCQLSGLQILDFSSNQLSGFIPQCIWNLTAMSFPHGGQSNPSIYISYWRIPDEFHTIVSAYVDSAWIMWKGKEWSFANIMGEVKLFDMSNNKLEGPIPDGISKLAGLVSLDLSRNRLNGSITQNIGKLTSLEYLDLSRNLLYGEIPGSLSTVSTLEILDVSYNNLSGRIPHGTQLQTFNASSYIGNPRLCGEPLLNCPGDPTPTNSPKEDKSIHEDTHHDDNDDNLFPGLYISVVLGFIVGFWGVCGTLVIKRSWRNAFFQIFDDIKDKLYMLAVVNKARVLQRNT